MSNFVAYKLLIKCMPTFLHRENQKIELIVPKESIFCDSSILKSWSKCSFVMEVVSIVQN